MRKTFTRTIVY